VLKCTLDLTRKRSQVQTLSRPPLFSQVRTSLAPEPASSPPGWAALGPRGIPGRQAHGPSRRVHSGQPARQRPRRVVARPAQGSRRRRATQARVVSLVGQQPSAAGASARARPAQVRDPRLPPLPDRSATTSAASPASKPPLPSTEPLGYAASHAEPNHSSREGPADRRFQGPRRADRRRDGRHRTDGRTTDGWTPDGRTPDGRTGRSRTDTRRADTGRLDTRRLDARRADTGRLDTGRPDEEPAWADTQWWTRTCSGLRRTARPT
jgi:hypothetical protein